ncbi:autoinducer binding domain-containing protein [Roseovarius aestuariivivens]|uniref:autoinducer binding domain-containing protein n=1 Tax=Roseovarius aestuariivivens TaxID=1888910 RepID=UPI0010801479|nr:autoinducer binding domain-containing protein [Roseovarius aestuariivivens]
MQLIDLADTPGEEPDFLAQLHGVCNTLGLEYASYASANPISGKIHAFTTYPDAWKDHYMAQSLHLVDPTLRAAARSIAPVDWRRLEHDNSFRDVFGPARDFNLPDTGLTIPVRGPMGDIGLFSVTATVAPDAWRRLTGPIMGQLQTAAVHLHDTVMHSDALTRILRQPHLSTREQEVLQWVAAGKSQQDIGDILSISSRTVEVHLRSAREKLCTLTTAQAVGRAVSLGLIQPR